MKIKLINLLTAFAIFTAFAAIIEYTIGWGMSNPWPFILVWSGITALAEVFILQPLRKRNAVKKVAQSAPKK